MTNAATPEKRGGTPNDQESDCPPVTASPAPRTPIAPTNDQGHTATEELWHFGRNLRNARERANLTVADVARETGIHTTQLAQIETGDHDPGLNLLVNLANAVGVPVATLLDGLR